MTGTNSRQIRWQVPRDHGAVLLVPSFAQCCIDVQRNLIGRRDWTFSLGEESIRSFITQARDEFLTAAHLWTNSCGFCPAEGKNPDGPIILTGHQPELFHPGVWLKNFVAARLAQAVGGVAVNIVIDNDRPKDLSVPILGGTQAEPVLARIPVDAGSLREPYEMRQVKDRQLFRSFAARAKEYLGAWVQHPLLEQFWPEVVDRLPTEPRLGHVIAQARHQLERQWGLCLLDVPLSWVADLPCHQRFLAFLLLEIPRVWQAYNRALDRFRKLHRLRNPAQPVPNLQATDGWWEVPYWVWSEQQPERRKLFARFDGSGLSLTDQHDWHVTLACAREGPAERLAQQLVLLRQHGVRLRPRALMTTFFARMVLGDYFIHGVGGARYDEVTDAMIWDLFGVRPPHFAVATGTLLLAQPEGRNWDLEIRQIKQLLRELKFHPERFFRGDFQFVDDWLAQAIRQTVAAAPSEEVAELMKRKLSWVRTPKTPENASIRHRAITEINLRLYRLLLDLERNLIGRLEYLRARKDRDTILRFRELPFCFFEETVLRKFFDQSTCQTGAGSI